MTSALRWAVPLLMVVLPATGWAQDAGTTDVVPTMADALTGTLDTAGQAEVGTAVKMLIVLTLLSLVPAMLLVMTPFTRFVIVFALLRHALGLQNSPPNQVLIGLSLMLSLVVMGPTLQQVNDDALQPYLAGEMTTEQAYDAGIAPMRAFMLRNVARPDLRTAMQLGRMARPETLADVPTPVVVTAFMLSELREAFIIGVKIYIPFLVVDVVVASVLLGMGMMMLPPVVISLPFKLLLFVLIDGWALLVTGLVAGVAG